LHAAEFRGEVLKACDDGEGTRAVETRFNVSESGVRLIKRRVASQANSPH
jgi:hypothetical protein